MNSAVAEPKVKPAQVQVAQLIRKELKRRGITNATVRSAQGKVTISVEDLSPKLEKEIKTYVAQFERGHFCGYEDAYVNSNKNNSIPQVKFVFFSNTFSDEMRQKAYDVMQERSPKNYAFLPKEASKIFHYHQDLDHRSVNETIDRVLRGKDILWSGYIWTNDELLDP